MIEDTEFKEKRDQRKRGPEFGIKLIEMGKCT